MRIHAVAKLTVGAGVVAVATLVALGDGNPWEVITDLEVDAAPAAIALPRGGTVQEAGVEIRVGGVPVSPDVLIGGWQVDRSRREAIQHASFSVALNEWGVSPLGDPFAALGSPTGTREIEFWGCYRNDTTGAVYKYPLLLRGVVDNVQRESGPSGHVEAYQVLDAGARWGRNPITFTLPAGHGLPTGRIVKKALTLAGETEFALEDGRRRYKEIQVVDGDALASSQEWLDVEARVLRWDRYGNAVMPTLLPPTSGNVVAIDEEDILSISVVRVVFPADAITEVTATGTEQIHTDTAEDLCGAVPTEFLVDTYDTFKPWEAAQYQAATCVLSAIAASGEEVEQLQTLTITRQVKRCGRLVHEESETWQHFAPEAARYYWGGASWECLDGTIIATTGVLGIYVDAATVAEDGNPAFAWPRATWQCIGRTVADHYYDAPGWAGPVGEWGAQLLGSVLGSETGKYLGSITDTSGWYNVRTATKDRGALPDPFETIDPRTNVLQLGNGTTVAAPAESFQNTSRGVLLVQSSSLGYKQVERALSYGFAVQPNGSQYQFTDGSLSGEADEQRLKLGEIRTVYTATAENAHTQTQIVTELGRSPRITNSTAEGAPPSVDYLPGYEPHDSTAFMDEEDQEFMVEADPNETRPIKVTVSSPSLLTTHLQRIAKTSFPYAEDSDELYAAAVSVIRESLIIGIDLTLAANFLIAEGQKMAVTHRPSGIGVARPAVLDSIGWSGSPEQAITSQLHLEVYPSVDA